MKRARNVLFPVVLLMVAVLMVVGCAPAPAPEKPIELNVATAMSQTHYSSVGQDYWAAELEKRTDGRVKPTIYYSQALGQASTYDDMLTSGAVDVALLAWGWLAGKYPLSEFLNLPFSWPSGAVATKVYYDLFAKGYFDEEAAKFKLVFLTASAPYNIVCTKPAHTPAQIKGMKFRSPGGAWTPTLEAWGATPEHMTTADVYSGMERNMIDGTVISLASAYGTKLYEVASDVTMINVGNFSFAWGMNWDVYNGLPKDIQKTIDELFDHMSSENVSIGYQADKEGLEAEEAFKKAGVTFYTLTPAETELWRAASKPIIDNWIEEMEAKGLPGKQFVEDLVASAAKYGAKPY